MKKLSLVFLSVLMVLALVACKKTSTKPAKVSPTPTKTATAEIMPTATATPQPQKQFEVGVVNGDTYTNNYLGLGYKLDSDDWKFCNEEEVKEINKFTEGLLSEDMKELAKNSSAYYDMIAVATDEKNLNVIFEKVDAEKLTGMDLQKNLEETCKQMKKELSNLGFSNINYATTTVEVDGVTYNGIKGSAQSEGTTLYMSQFIVKCPEHLAVITTTTPNTDTTMDILADFYHLG